MSAPGGEAPPPSLPTEAGTKPNTPGAVPTSTSAPTPTASPRDAAPAAEPVAAPASENAPPSVIPPAKDVEGALSSASAAPPVAPPAAHPPTNARDVSSSPAAPAALPAAPPIAKPPANLGDSAGSAEPPVASSSAQQTTSPVAKEDDLALTDIATGSKTAGLSTLANPSGTHKDATPTAKPAPVQLAHSAPASASNASQAPTQAQLPTQNVAPPASQSTASSSTQQPPSTQAKLPAQLPATAASQDYASSLAQQAVPKRNMPRPQEDAPPVPTTATPQAFQNVVASSSQPAAPKKDLSKGQEAVKAAPTAANPQTKPQDAPETSVPTPSADPKPASGADPKPKPTPVAKSTPPSAPKATASTTPKPIAKTSGTPTAKAAPAGAATPVQRPLGSISLEIARMVSEFLGPLHPRRESVGATLNGLRTRLETNTAKFDADRETLIWQVREAIRTEFFKIIYPAPPSAVLLSLVTRTEILLTSYHQKNRPFFFPGARVAVPTEAGSRRAGTTLQLRFKTVGETTVTEALLHLDGPNGGGFQWVQTPALTPLMVYATPVRPTPVVRRVPPQKTTIAIARTKRSGKTPTRAPRVRAPRPSAASKKKAAVARAAAAKAIAAANAKVAAIPKKPQDPPPPPPPPTGPVALPPAFLPEALLSTSPPPRKRLRSDVDRPMSHSAGSLRRALDVDTSSGEMALDSIGRIRRLVGIERLVARRQVSGTGSIEYFVKWSGRGMREGSWERRESLMVDVPALVVDFDTRHPDEPKIICHSDRMKTAEEELGALSKTGENVQTNLEADAGGEQKQEESSGATKADDNDVKMEDVEENAREDGRPVAPKAAAEERKYVDEVSGIAIPGYLDTPIFELGFAGMVLQIRQSKEWALHNDALAAVRDYKKRQSRFKQEDVQEAEQLFPLTKSEARTALDASLRAHKTHNRRPIPFPRGLGRAVSSDTGNPFSKEVLAVAPPTWESYLLGLGLTPKHFERELPPLMPTLDIKTTRRVAVVAKDASFERAVEHRERARRVVRAAYRHTGNADPPTALFREGKRRPGECDTCFPMKNVAPVKKTKSPRVPEPTIKRDPAFAAALAAATERAKATTDKEDKKERWFDPVWSCWRAGTGPSVQ